MSCIDEDGAEPERGFKDFDKSGVLGSMGNGTQTTCASTGTPAVGDLGVPDDQDLASRLSSRDLEERILERELRSSRPATAERILERELRSSRPAAAERALDMRSSRPGTAESQGGLSLRGVCFSRTGFLEQDCGLPDIVASALSREVVEEAARSTRLPTLSRHSSKDGMVSVLSAQGHDASVGETVDVLSQDLKIGRDLAESFSQMLTEELDLTGCQRPSSGSRRSRLPSRPPAPAEAAGEGPPSPPAPPVLPPPPLARPPPPAEPAPRLELEPLGEESPDKSQHEEGVASPNSEWAGVESVASFSTVASLGTDAGCGLKALATIEEEEALLSILDRVMLDVGQDLSDGCAQQLKLAGRGQALADGVVHWRGAEVKQAVAGAQDLAAGQRRPTSACSVASLQPSQSMDERLYCNEFSTALWQEMCERLDGSLPGRSAAHGQEDRCPPLPQGTGTAA